MPLVDPPSPTPYKMRTRATNATCRPGLVVLEQMQKRRTRAEVAHEKMVHAQEQEELTMKRDATLQRIAHLEAQQKDKTPGSAVVPRRLTARDLRNFTAKESESSGARASSSQSSSSSAAKLQSQTIAIDQDVEDIEDDSEALEPSPWSDAERIDADVEDEDEIEEIEEEEEVEGKGKGKRVASQSAIASVPKRLKPLCRADIEAHQDLFISGQGGRSNTSRPATAAPTTQVDASNERHKAPAKEEVRAAHPKENPHLTVFKPSTQVSSINLATIAHPRRHPPNSTFFKSVIRTERRPPPKDVQPISIPSSGSEGNVAETRTTTKSLAVARTLVKAENDAAQVLASLKARPARRPNGSKRVTLKDLPSDIDRKIWTDVFMPTCVEIVSQYDDPWTFPETQLLDDIKSAFFRLFKTTKTKEHDINTGHAVYSLSQKRIREWRYKTGRDALLTLSVFFARDPKYTNPEARAAFASEQRIDEFEYRFLYTEYEPHEVRSGAYCSTLIAETFASHLATVKDSFIHTSDITNLDTFVPPIGALALVSAAMERAILLYTGDGMPPRSQGSMKKYTEFSALLSKSSTSGYARSISRLDHFEWVTIYEAAHPFVAAKARRISRTIFNDMSGDDASSKDDGDGTLGRANIGNDATLDD